MVLQLLIIIGVLIFGLLLGYFLGLKMHDPGQKNQSRSFKR
jgi:uncharacterized protein YneF (UPF0154 family)